MYCDAVPWLNVFYRCSCIVLEELSEKFSPADTVELKAMKTMFKSCMTKDGSNRKKSKTLYKYQYYLIIFFIMLVLWPERKSLANIHVYKICDIRY